MMWCPPVSTAKVSQSGNVEHGLICLPADVFSQHLDVELSEDDVQVVTSNPQAKTQVTVRPPPVRQQRFASVFSSLLSLLLYLVAKVGNSAGDKTSGEVWMCWCSERRRPPCFSQASGEPLEDSQPAAQFWRGEGGEQPPAAGAAGCHGHLQGPLLLPGLPPEAGPTGPQRVLPPRSQPRAEGQLPGPRSQRSAQRSEERRRSRTGGRAQRPGTDPAQGPRAGASS